MEEVTFPLFRKEEMKASLPRPKDEGSFLFSPRTPWSDRLLRGRENLP